MYSIVSWPGFELLTLRYQSDALNNWATWPGLQPTPLKDWRLYFVPQVSLGFLPSQLAFPKLLLCPQTSLGSCLDIDESPGHLQWVSVHFLALTLIVGRHQPSIPPPVNLRLFQLVNVALSDPAICSFCSALFRADPPALQPSSQPSSCCLCAISKGAVKHNRKAGADALCDQGSSEFYSLIPIRKCQFKLLHLLLSLFILCQVLLLHSPWPQGSRYPWISSILGSICTELECHTLRFS